MKISRTKSSNSPGRERFLWPAMAVFGLALLVRLVHLWQIRTAPFFNLKMGDAESYDAWARQIAAGDWLGNEIFYQAPLYPYLLGAVYTLLGDSGLIVRALQAVLGALACVLLADAGRRLFSRSVGIVAGSLLALYAPAIFLDSLIQKAGLASFLFCLLLWLLSRLVEQPRLSGWWWTGLALGLLILTRENAVLFLFVILVWLCIQYRALGSRRFVFAALLLAGISAVLVPVAVRNRVVGGEYHLTTSQLGSNLYIGNNERANGSYVPLRPGRDNPKYERQDATELAQEAVGRELSPAEVSRYWTRRTLQYITEHPGDWLRLMGRKAALVWNAAEIEDTEDQYTYADWSVALRVTGYVFHFGVVAPLACLGIWLTRKQRGTLWLLYVLVAVYASSVVMFFVFARYRFPLVPLLVLFAAAGLVELAGYLRQASRAELWAVAACVLAVTVFCNWRIISKAEMRANTLTNLGIAVQADDRPYEATRYYRQALLVAPNNAKTHYNLGNALKAQDKLEEATHHYRRAVEIEADHVRAHYNLANSLQLQGNANEAIRHYRQTLQLDPDHVKAHVNLGVVLKSEGRLDEAISQFRQALRRDDGLVEAHVHLAEVLGIQGKLDEALDHFRRALEGQPDNAMVHYNLGLTLAIVGRLGETLVHFREAARLRPGWPAPLDDMAWILATHPDPSLRNPEAAVQLAEQAAQLTRLRDPAVLDTLAAAYAAAGQFERAVATAQTAITLIPADQGEALVKEIQARLELYRRAKPYREPVAP